MNPRRLIPSTSSLIAFEASARHLSFTRAAAELSITQSAVSRQVSALEELLEVALFRRDGRRIVLTEVGASYQREIAAALQRISGASIQAHAFRAEDNTLQLAALPAFAAKWLMPRMHSFYEGHPGTVVHMHSRVNQFDADLAGFDAVIGVGDGIWPGMAAHHLVDEIVVPVISPALLKAKPLQTPADIAQHPLLMVVSRPYVWRQWFAAHKVPLRRMKLGPQFEMTSHLVQAVSSGIGVGLLPSILVEDELRNGTLALAFDDRPLATGAAYHLFVPTGKLERAPVKAFRDWIVGLARE